MVIDILCYAILGMTVFLLGIEACYGILIILRRILIGRRKVTIRKRADRIN